MLIQLAVGIEQIALGDGKLWLTDDVFARGSIIVDSCEADDAVLYGAADGPRLRVGWSNLPTLVIWTLPGAPFVCIEPWAGESDAKDYAGDLRDRYLARLAERKARLMELARAVGWHYHCHHTGQPAQSALLWAWAALEGGR